MECGKEEFGDRLQTRIGEQRDTQCRQDDGEEENSGLQEEDASSTYPDHDTPLLHWESLRLGERVRRYPRSSACEKTSANCSLSLHPSSVDRLRTQITAMPADAKRNAWGNDAEKIAPRGRNQKRPKMHWGEEKRAQIRQMIAARRALGWEVPLERQTLRLTDDGLTFMGTPTTSRAYWGELSATLLPERVTAMKQLVTLKTRVEK